MAITYHSGRRIQGNTSEYKVHTFTTTGTTTFGVSGSGDIEYLVIAGGAGGGHGGTHEPGGGGGAGGFVTDYGYGVTAQNYTVTVGTGGASATSDQVTGSNGVNSSIVPTSGTSIISSGGGGAASGTLNSGNANNGGSGGGGSAITGSHIGGLSSGGEGFNGGTGYRAPDYEAGGGGGASEVGESPVTGAARGGNGGDGLQSSINGTATYYAGGGGGGVEYAETPGQGGLGGGGAGGVGNGGNGSNATGYGSGGGGGDNSGDGGNGSAGIVIIRYLTSSGITATGGTITTITGKDWKPINVQLTSRYEETDTRKIYYRDDVDWKELDGAEATNYTSESWYEQLSGETP